MVHLKTLVWAHCIENKFYHKRLDSHGKLTINSKYFLSEKKKTSKLDKAFILEGSLEQEVNTCRPCLGIYLSNNTQPTLLLMINTVKSLEVSKASVNKKNMVSKKLIT